MGKMKEIYIMCMNDDSTETIAKWIMKNAASKPDKKGALELARNFKNEIGTKWEE